MKSSKSTLNVCMYILLNIQEIKCIGRGSSGEVWLANYKISEHVEPIQVAIKEISIGKK